MVDITTEKAVGGMALSASERVGERHRLGVMFWLAVLWLVLISTLAALAPWLGLPDPARIDYMTTQLKPSAAHWFGTDVLGRDILSRVIYGARVSLLVGVLAPGIGMSVGTLLGLVAGYYRGRVDTAICTGIDILLAVPGLVLLLLFSLIFGGGLTVVSLSLGFLFIPAFTRVARANTLVYTSRDFVTATQALGAGDLHILFRTLLPNVIIPVVAFALVAVAGAIVIEGALSFLGLSVETPIPTWGKTISEGREYLEESPHICLFPTAVMFLTVLSFNLVGDTLRSRYADVQFSNL